MGLSNLFAAGGVVMWPLLAFSVLGFALIIERVAFWWRINRRQERVATASIFGTRVRTNY